MTTLTCDLCQKNIPSKVDQFILTLSAASKLLDRPLFTLDLCAQCANHLKPDAHNFPETIATTVKGRTTRSGKGA